jgi:hypothetical protein
MSRFIMDTVSNQLEIFMNEQMDAAAVRAYVATKWPDAMKSPVAVVCHEAAAVDELHRDAVEHAYHCLRAGDGWTVETLSHNIESSFPEFDMDECDAIAESVLGR